GIGGRTCAFWLSSPNHRSEGAVWIYGFWSGLNYVAASSQQNQSKATRDAMISAVEQTCRSHPSRVLAAVAWSAYIDLNKELPRCVGDHVRQVKRSKVADQVRSNGRHISTSYAS